jgi:acyl-CoA dehydrogenase
VSDGDGWRITGEKWFATNARHAEFLIVVAVTNPDVDAYRGQSMFLVPKDAEGLEIVRNVGIGGEPSGTGTHAYLRFTDVAVGSSNLLGAEGQAFAIAQTRLGGGRIHHAMRTIAQVRKAFDMMCERALSRETRSGSLARLGVVQEQIADSWLQIEQFRLLVLRSAWLIDKHGDYRRVRKDISAVKAAMPIVYSDVARRALHLHGALGVSDEMPFAHMLVDAEVMGLADGPTAVHKSVLAREVLKLHRPSESDFPSGHLPTLRAAARRHVADRLEREVAAL